MRKKRVGFSIREEGERYIYPPSPQRSLKSQIAVGEERKRYIYTLAHNGHRTQGVERDEARGLEVERDGSRDLGVGRDGSCDLGVGRDGARDLRVRRDGSRTQGVRRDRLIRLEPFEEVSVGANFLVP